MTRTAFGVIALMVLATACGGDDPTDPYGNGNGGGGTLVNGTFSATVSGSAFNPAAVVVTYSGGIIALGASDAQGRGFGFAFQAGGPGTYTVSQAGGMNATWAEGNAGWAAGGSIGSGSVTLSTLNASRAAGSFNLTLAASSGGATGTKVMQGSFDITY